MPYWPKRRLHGRGHHGDIARRQQFLSLPNSILQQELAIAGPVARGGIHIRRAHQGAVFVGLDRGGGNPEWD